MNIIKEHFIVSLLLVCDSDSCGAKLLAPSTHRPSHGSINSVWADHCGDYQQLKMYLQTTSGFYILQRIVLHCPQTVLRHTDRTVTVAKGIFWSIGLLSLLLPNAIAWVWIFNLICNAILYDTMPPKKPIIDDNGINFGQLDKVIRGQLDADAKYDRENDAKFRAVRQKVPNS